MMQSIQRSPRTSRLLAISGRFLPVGLLLAAAIPASADSVFVGSGTAVLERKDVRVTKIENGIVHFETQAGGATSKGMNEVRKMLITGETPFNTAEEAYEKGDFKTAAANYKRALDVTQKPFVKVRAAARLSEAAAKSGDFGLAVSAWLQQVPLTDVASAAKLKPAAPAGTTPAVLNAAAAELERAGTAARTPDQKTMILTYAVETYQAAGNSAASDALLKRLTGGAAPATPAVGAAPGVAKAATPGLSGDLVLAQAKQAVGARDYAKAIAVIEANRAGIVTPDNQAEALYMLASSKEALAANDPGKLQDAAIAYMRVVAHFDGKQVATANIPAALWKVADIQERLKNNEEAMQIFNQLAGDPKLKGTAIQTEATKRIAALKAAKG